MIRETKEAVAYIDEHGSSDEQCSKCVYFVDATTCEIVIGKINPNGWCRRFHETPASFAPR